MLRREGKLQEAEQELSRSLAIKQEVQDLGGVPELYVWLGELYEARARMLSDEVRKTQLETAETCYNQCLDFRWAGIRYFEGGALSGLVRVKCAQGDFDAAQSLLIEAEQLAQQYEYNDHLASLRLTQGHIAWGGHIPECAGGFEAGLQFYREALIYALRHNRFLLDEVLWGGGITTPLEPIISHCLEYGEEGRKMLIALSDWWRTGFNEVGVPRLDTISQVPEDISLFAAECAARERESGDGSPQKKVIECIESMLDSLS